MIIREKLKQWFRFRKCVLWGGSLLVIAYLLVSDPNDGELTIPFLAKLATPIIAVWFAHIARKALFDYLDMAQIAKKARETATGSGLVFLGICIVIFGLLGLFGSQVYAQDVNTYIPQQAYQHLPTLQLEKDMYWPEHPKHLPLVD